MLEIPESTVIAEQVASILTGKTITEIFPASSPHKFTFYNGTLNEYKDLLIGKTINQAKGHGAFLDIICQDDVRISISDGTNLTYYPAIEKQPDKFQLLITFDDNSFLVFTVAMYGGISVFQHLFDNKYYKGSIESISPLSDKFDRYFFDKIIDTPTKDLSAKALLATEQRIPGLGNGCLQDIFFCAGIHPKRKRSTLTNLERDDLFHSLKTTLQSMTEKGGRDTEKDFYGHWGGYQTILSKNTYKKPCPNCGNSLVKEAYLGGTIYFCSSCQKC